MNSNNEPKIITDWDSIPYNVVADGELISTRLLYKAHNDMKNKIERLESNIERLMCDIKIYNPPANDLIDELTRILKG